MMKHLTLHPPETSGKTLYILPGCIDAVLDYGDGSFTKVFTQSGQQFLVKEKAEEVVTMLHKAFGSELPTFEKKET